MIFFLPRDPENGRTDPAKPYLGVSFCGNTTAEAKMLIDKTKDYTNLFVLQSGPLSKNETGINLICDYAVDSGLDFIVFLGWFDFEHPWQIPWLDFAKNRWGDRFLGLYLYDEPGGIQLDYNWTRLFQRIRGFYPSFYESIAPYVGGDVNETVVRDYEEAKRGYLDYIVNQIQVGELINRSITAFTSDYALYWFDYLAGYDTVFVELGWNHSTPKHIGLCRGAATAQQKDWGTIIVWNALDPENDKKGAYKTGEEMLQDLLVAYETGAKYMIIFNYPTDPPGNPYGILTEEHFTALQQFWSYIQQNPEENGKTEAQAALVLPKNYGWGMRHPDDRIWGYWGPDEISPQIWELSLKLLDRYGLALDIVYDDPNFPIEDIYQDIYYWNYTG
ncbi:MAG: hypothetical protein JSV75_01630 [Candidatus Bathyarchaeota archaeon]|nr:MAG: hypothetical protein JSV75_01630 [Candidatus Bathyarchaeota archaeon]